MECSSMLMVVVSSILLAITQAASVAESRQDLEPSLEKLKGYLKSGAEEPAGLDDSRYFTDDVLPPVYLSKIIDDTEEDEKRGTLFRYGKRGSLFRYGKRGYIFRYGRGDDNGFENGLEVDDYPRNDKRTIFRYGKRARALHAPFRFGKALERDGESRA